MSLSGEMGCKLKRHVKWVHREKKDAIDGSKAFL